MDNIFLITGSWLIADGASSILKRSFVHAPEGLILVGIVMLFIVEKGFLLGKAANGAEKETKGRLATI